MSSHPSGGDLPGTAARRQAPDGSPVQRRRQTAAKKPSVPWRCGHSRSMPSWHSEAACSTFWRSSTSAASSISKSGWASVKARTMASFSASSTLQVA